MKTAGGLVEYVHVPDVFVSGVAEIEWVDGCARLVFYSRTKSYDGSETGVTELVITARLVIPAAMIAGIADAIAKFSEQEAAAADRHVSPRLDVN